MHSQQGLCIFILEKTGQVILKSANGVRFGASGVKFFKTSKIFFGLFGNLDFKNIFWLLFYEQMDE